MRKIKRYIILSKYVHIKRDAMRAAKEKITSYQKEYFLDKPESMWLPACINKFERVYGICLDPDAYDEHGDFTKNCELFGTMLCIDQKCPFYAKKLDYIAAQEKYDMALAKRREFRQNLFHKKTK